jgi:hypothetical protein
VLAYAAQTQSSYNGFEKYVRKQLGDAAGEAALAGLSDDARLVWQAFAFLAPGGKKFNPAVGLQHGQKFGIRSAVGYLLDKANQEGRPIDLNEILTDVSLHGTHSISSAKVRAAETRFVEALNSRADVQESTGDSEL